MTTVRLSEQQVTRLVDLLTVVANATDTSDEDRYQLDYSRGQVRQLMPAIEVLVLAGVLTEMTDRPGPGAAARDDCRRWSAVLAHLLAVGSEVHERALSSIAPGPRAPRRAA